MKISSLVLAGALSLSATVATASTILAPTDGDVNFIVDTSFVPSGYQLAVFDDSDAVVAGGVITSASNLNVIFTASSFYYGGIINFTNSGSWSASNGVDTLGLGSSSNFIVGLSTDGGSTWYADDDNAAVAGPANTVTLSFPAGETSSFLVDVQLAPVPVPAAAWLFGTGLIGLVGVARRRA